MLRKSDAAKLRVTVLVHQPSVGALGFRLADLPFVIPDLDIEDLHQRMDLLAKAVIAVIDLLGCQERIVVREILIVLADLCLDVLQLPVQPSCLLGFAFDIPKGKGNITLAAETRRRSVDGNTPHDRDTAIFYGLVLGVEQNSKGTPHNSIIFDRKLLFIELS